MRKKERNDYRFLMLTARSLVVIIVEKVERKKLLKEKKKLAPPIQTTYCRSLKFPYFIFLLFGFRIALVRLCSEKVARAKTRDSQHYYMLSVFPFDFIFLRVSLSIIYFLLMVFFFIKEEDFL